MPIVATLIAAVLATTAGAAMTPAEVDRLLATPALTPGSAANVVASCDVHLAAAGRIRAELETETGPATIAGSFRRYDELQRILAAASADAYLLGEVAPDDARREAGRTCYGRVSDASTAISLSRAIYDRLKAIPATDGDAVSRRLLTRTLEGYERAGVAGDAAARARIEALQGEITKQGLAFDANIANGQKTVQATVAELAGLPADFIAAHPPGPDGKVSLTTATPDYTPVMTYAHSEPLRRRMNDAWLTRAYPANEPVLTALFTARHRLAKELGRPDFATLALEDKMIASPARASAFLDQVSAAANAPARRDLARMLDRLKRIDPAANAVPQWSAGYLQQLIRKESYAVDPQQVRRYFAYNNVRDGILRLTEDLFGVTIRRWDTPLWDPAVEAYEMVERGAVIGRFYFDTHPRPGKYGHANVITLRDGIRGRTVPLVALVTNFPSGDHRTGLMEHRDVETFLHEYGHLIHAIFAGKQEWIAASMGAVEWDFIEAPSQMLENWVWDYDTLAGFAVDAEGHTIPRDLVAAMNRARYFGEAYGDRRQAGLSNVSLAYHQGPPAGDLTATYRTAYDRYALTPVAPGLHPQDSFNHLSGYSAYYYTYTWSKAIAVDLFTAFQKNGFRDRATAALYRERVLAPGGSKPAGELVRDFLGRPFSLDAYRERLAKGD